MSKKDKHEVLFWTLLTLACLALLTYALFGCAEASAEPSQSASIPQMEAVEKSDELAQQHRSHEVEAVEAGKLDTEGEPIDEPQEEPAEEPGGAYEGYYEPVYYGYSGGATVTTTHDLLNGQGRAYDGNGTSYTYYNHDLGWGPLDIPGENFDADGVSHDGDGYIVVAADGHAKGEVIDTPYGQAKVYDSGSGYGNVDIYTNR